MPESARVSCAAGFAVDSLSERRAATCEGANTMTAAQWVDIACRWRVACRSGNNITASVQAAF
jgi:hypothetical protein